MTANDTTMQDGDRLFTGWNAAVSPEVLPQGVLALSVNNRLRSGVVARRGGYHKTGWWNPIGYPWHNRMNLGWSGSIAQGSQGTVEPASTWFNGQTMEASAARRVRWTLTRNSGPVFNANFAHGYVLWPDGLVQQVVERLDGNTVLVTDVQGFGGSVNGIESFTWDSLQLQGTFAEFASTPLLRAGEFDDPNGEHWDMRIGNDRVWLARHSYQPWSVPIQDGGVAIGDEPFILQCFDKVLLFRGNGKDVLQWDGTEDGAFERVPDPIRGFANPEGTAYLTSPSGAFLIQPDANDFTQRIPPAERGLFFANRVWTWVDDTIAVSDIGVYARYDYLENEFRLNDGSSDRIVAMHPYGRRAILVFFSRSIFLLENVFGTLDNMTARRVSSAIGCGAPNTICDVADDVWWADADGRVWRLQQVDDDRMELVGRPITWPIEPDMTAQSVGRVRHWHAAYLDGLYYLCTRREDNSGGPIYVYDTILEAWVSRDQIDGLEWGMPQVLGIIRMPAYGAQRLLLQTAHHSLVVDWCDTDNVDGRDRTIRQQIRTRALSLTPLRTKRAIGMTMLCRTLNPSITATICGQGVSQRQKWYDAKTVVRTRYTAWGKTPYALDNAQDDYQAPHREDYLIRVSDNFRLHGPSTSEIEVNPMQEWRLQTPIRALAESISLEISNADALQNEVTAFTLAAWRLEALDAGHEPRSRT